MHLIKNENGDFVSHGHGHEQEHTHEHTHDHNHCEDGCNHCEKDCDPKKETLALLTYMLQHNEHHAKELDQMAENLEKLNMGSAAAQIREGVSEFQKGNIRLSLALTLVKEQLKEEA